MDFFIFMDGIYTKSFEIDVNMCTPLEAFKTDVFYSFMSTPRFYPMLSSLQINTQLLLLSSFLVFILFTIGLLLYDLRIINKILYFYVQLCNFFSDQLSFTMRNYFVSFIVILLVVGGFNIIGLIPYNGSFTAQIIINLNFTISIIIGLVLIGFNIQGIRFLLNFVPSNIPIIMVPFLFLIELLSFFMRIFSMSIRLFSNMVAGHSLLHLLHEFGLFVMYLVSGNAFLVIVSLIPLIILYFWLFFELFVAFLQAYVFVLLYLLYVNDINKSH